MVNRPAPFIPSVEDFPLLPSVPLPAPHPSYPPRTLSPAALCRIAPAVPSSSVNFHPLSRSPSSQILSFLIQHAPTQFLHATSYGTVTVTLLSISKDNLLRLYTHTPAALIHRHIWCFPPIFTSLITSSTMTSHLRDVDLLPPANIIPFAICDHVPQCIRHRFTTF
ncbi:hypothetical protein PCANC_20219 [Puccinia coronata f. sp. avenae]|uniref:Uncharacterized protein n=1 Tax=Puccinia coronata f. sp. avenae TaxID=200324 RepID=A0A2N5U3T7_9BASI|nr:hypothetical protein PCANC_20219 [Puccinia coronata f. sp. avenae]